MLWYLKLLMLQSCSSSQPDADSLRSAEYDRHHLGNTYRTRSHFHLDTGFLSTGHQ